MSLVKYEILKVVAESGSISKAAEKLSLTQPAVSHSISSLEKEMGFSLFTRSKLGITLTMNGEHVLKQVRKILAEEEKLNQLVAKIKGVEIGNVRVASFSSVSMYLLPQIIKEFEQTHLSIELDLFEGDYEEILNWIQKGQVDFGFVSLPVTDSLEVMPIKKDRMLCIVPLNHPLSKKQQLTVEDFENVPFIMPKGGCALDVIRTLQQHNITPTIKFEIGEDLTITSMVKNGLGISILPELILTGMEKDLKILEIKGEESYRTIGIATKSFQLLSPAADKFLTILKSRM